MKKMGGSSPGIGEGCIYGTDNGSAVVDDEHIKRYAATRMPSIETKDTHRNNDAHTVEEIRVATGG